MIDGSRFLMRSLLAVSVAVASVPALASAAETAPSKSPEPPSQAEPKASPPADTSAATKPDAAPTAAPTAEGKDKGPATKPGTEGAAVDQETLDEAIAGGSVVELPNKTYYFIGARYRGIIVPKFMINLFADGGRTVYVNAFGPEFAIRKNGFEYNLSSWLGLYDMKDTPLKGKSDDANGWEIISSKVNTLYFSSDFLWSNEFTPAFSLTYGAGVGIGAVFGKVIRTEARPKSLATVSDENSYVKCTSAIDPINDPGGFCTDAGKQIDYSEPSWAHGGSKPVLFPWLTLQTGLRYKIHRNFVTRLDLGFGTSGFFFGLGADYGL